MKEGQSASSINHVFDYPFAGPKMDGKWIRIARIGWIILAIFSLVILVGSFPGYLAKFRGQLGHINESEIIPGAQFFAAASGVASLVSALLSMGLAALLFRRKFSEPMTVIVSYFLLIFAFVMSGPLEHIGIIFPGFLEYVFLLQGTLLATPMFALLMLFPTGKFVPSWTRWVFLLSIPWNIGLVMIAPFDAESMGQKPIITGMVAIFSIVFSCIGIYSQIYRYRKISTATERVQTRWVVFGFTLWIAYIFVSTLPYIYLINLPQGSPVPWWGPASELGWWLSLNILPVSLTVAITKSKLWDIDVVINRTLVYGTLTIATMAFYILVVGLFGSLLRFDNRSIIAFVATGLVAIVFQPLRVRLQNGVNRMMYGERDNPVSVLSKLGEELEQTGSPEDTLSSITRTVATTLKLPYVAIELGENHEIAISYGVPKNETIRLPMIYQAKTIGYFVVAYRSQGELFRHSELQLLENIARQAGAAAHATKLNAELLISRQQLVRTREEERRRIRRDLHDGLGPQLASQTLTLTAARRLLSDDPQAADNLIREAIKHAQSATEDLRRMVYDLRPPSLDDLGLIGAIQTQVRRFESDQLHIDVNLPAKLPSLPAAVEVACFMIFQEALTNIGRHSKAKHCSISLMINAGLELYVNDDGLGIAPVHHSGVGLNSMRQRAEELGGRFTIQSAPGKGTRIEIHLPFDFRSPIE
ncbi:MAG: sensor histidine kinase [Anaerolineaceae bacterium]|nr:sensor histidine kinase [Anaerolineaceae bacterium]